MKNLILVLILPLWLMADNFIFLSQPERPCPPCPPLQEQTPKAATQPTVTTSGDRYWVQIGAYQKPQNAKAKIEAAGQAGWVAQARQEAGLTRVVIGPFESRAEAARTLGGIRALEREAFIRRQP